MFDGANGAREVVEMPHGGHAGSEPGWREIDRQLRRVAKRRGELDAEELRWLALAQRVELHRELGYATMLEYIERVLGYGPKLGRERLRIARALVELPAMAETMSAGAITYSVIRELTRFVVSETEDEWLEAVRGKTLREVEEMSSGRKRGDRPSDTPDPAIAIRPITVELTPATLALFRDARRRLEDEMGHPLTDDEVIAAMCASVLRPQSPEPALADEAPAADTSGRAAYQVALSLCPSCERGWHDAGGASIEIPSSTIEQAHCDAEYIGRTAAAAPERSEQEVPPATVRLVKRRDRGRCRVPGCRSGRWLQIHHIVHRADGGTNEPTNLICLCFAHHQAHHQGKLLIAGTVPENVSFVFAFDDS